MSTALEAPVAEIETAVKAQPVAHVDETRWQEGKGRAWLWVVVTQVATVFLIRLSRGAQVAKEMIDFSQHFAQHKPDIDLPFGVDFQIVEEVSLPH